MVASFRRSVYDVLLNDVPMVDIVEPTGYNNLFVAPATPGPGRCRTGAHYVQ